MCGLFGFSDSGQKLSPAQRNNIIEALSVESAVRGTDSTGISYCSSGKVKIEKAAKSAYELHFKLPKDAQVVIGHTRHATQGDSKKWYNNHPFQGRLRSGLSFALTHNGVISNDTILRRTYHLPNTKIETDSYVAVQLLERNKRLSFSSLKEMAEAVSGSFSFSLLDSRSNLYLVKGDSPLSILHLTSLNLYVYASTEQILWRAMSTVLLSELKSGHFEEVPIKEGEILKLSPDGSITHGEFAYHSDDDLFGPYGWWNWGCTRFPDEKAEDDYASLLKSMAGSFGYTSGEVDALLQEGYSLEEVEELFYCDDEQLR